MVNLKPVTDDKHIKYLVIEAELYPSYLIVNASD